MDNNNISDELNAEVLSKTKRKQIMHNLQEIGESLVLLNDNQLKKITHLLPENLLSAIYEAKRLISQNARSGKKRQLQYIGKLMREVNAEIIVDTLSQIQNTNTNANNLQSINKVNNLCQQIITNDENNIFTLLNNLTISDQQKREYHFQLRTLRRNIIKENSGQVNQNFTNTKNYKNLFQLVKNIFEI